MMAQHSNHTFLLPTAAGHKQVLQGDQLGNNQSRSNAVHGSVAVCTLTHQDKMHAACLYHAMRLCNNLCNTVLVHFRTEQFTNTLLSSQYVF